jgi:hypothetical protein
MDVTSQPVKADLIRQSTSHIERLSATWRDLPIDLISRSPIARWAPIPLRLIVGNGFMEHGFAKLARGLDAFPEILQALGVPAPHLMGWLTILVEAGRIDVLFVVAGGGTMLPLGSITEEYDDTFGGNAKGVLFTVQKALPLLVDGASRPRATQDNKAPPSPFSS